MVYTAYYPSFSQNYLGASYQGFVLGLPVENIPWNRITYLVHFASNETVTQTSPYTAITVDGNGIVQGSVGIDLEYSQWDINTAPPGYGYTVSPPVAYPGWQRYQKVLIDSAHAHGVKVLYDIHAVGSGGNTALDYITQDQGRTNTFVNAVVSYVNLRGYDGVQIDWEFWTNWNLGPPTQTARLISTLRSALGSSKILILSPGPYDWGHYDPASDAYLDQICLQTYAYNPAYYGSPVNANAVWYDSPLHKGTIPANFGGEAFDTRGAPNWVAAGHDPQKISLGIYSGAHVAQNADALYEAYLNGAMGEGQYKDGIQLLSNGGTLGWDAARVVPYIYGTAINAQGNTWYGQPGVTAGQKFFATFEDSISIKSKIDWIGQQGYGGLMVYNLTSDILDLRYGSNPIAGKTNPIHKWVTAAMGSANLPTGYISASPAVFNVGGGTTTLTWTSNNATSASIDQGIGSVNLNGSLNVNVTSTKTFTLTLTNSYGSQTYSVIVSVSLGTPVISAVNASNITYYGATIQWTTNVASNSQVEYGLTTSYGNTTSVDPNFVTSHSVILSNLTASTLYHYRVKSTEAAGYQTVSSDYTFTTAAPPPPSTIVSDDFNSSSLNTSVWTFVNPLSDATLSLIGTGTQDALLSIAIPAGQEHDVWTGGNFAPRIMQQANNTDFEVEAKFQSVLNSGYQLQGIIVEQDASNYIRFDFVRTESNLTIFAATIISGTATSKGQTVITANNPLYLRVKRQGDQWTQTYSYNGSTWTSAATFSQSLTVSKVGVFIGNAVYANNAPAFTGLIDYFFNTASSIVPEDTNTGTPSTPTLSSPANGATGVATNPTLSWNASSGATSYGLQVSSSSSFSTTVVNQTGITTTSYAVTGLANNTTYYWRVNATNAGGTSAYSTAWSFTTSMSHSIVLPQGWDMISSVAQPLDSTLNTLLAKVIPHMVLMKNGLGQVFWPADSINTMGTWNYHQGYQIYMLSADTLAVTGSEIVPEATPIPLVQGVTLVPYLRHSPMRADSALAGVSSNLVIAKNNAGQVYWPAYGINTIGSLKPGQGYQVQVTLAGILTYPANTSPSPPSLLTKSQAIVHVMDLPVPQHYGPSVSNTGANAILLVEAPDLNEGDEVATWTAGKLLVGSGVISQGKALITIWGDNGATQDVTDGAVGGESLSLTVWSVAEGTARSLALSSVSDALVGTTSAPPLRYKTDAVWVARVMQLTEIPQTFTLSQNYPNPFNPSSVIRYGLPHDGMVTLEVFNILGQRVALVVNEEQKAGYHEVLFRNPALGSGVYFYRLSSAGFSETKKMMVVR